ncbi:MAG: PQQ-binding-like beta-propeller repeat protein [Lentisphaeria bacterium]|nr:PQQ-binding-like beta-propeller repeat protein [Lentisphaeria bacterium]
MKKFLTVTFALLGSILPAGVVFLDLNSNSVRDAGEPGIPSVAVSNGRETVLTGSDGTFSFVSGGYWIAVTTPDKHLPTTPIWADKGAAPEFGFKPDPRSSDGAVFIHGSDIQFNVAKKSERFRHTVQKIAAAAKKHRTDMVICSGDLTPDGRLDDMQVIRDEFKAAGLDFYPVFGGHDAQKHRDLANYRKVFGPLWYSWNFRGVHFCAFVSESFLTPVEFKEQYAWLKRDIALTPADMPLVLVTHAPGQASRTISDALCGREPELILRGHYHHWNVRRTGKTSIVCSAPWREGDSGAQTNRIRVISRSAGEWKSSIEFVHPFKETIPSAGKAQVILSGDWLSVAGNSANRRISSAAFGRLVPVWHFRAGGYQDYFGSPVISDGKVFVPVSDSGVSPANAGIAAVDAKSGKLIWKAQTCDDVCATPVICGGIIAVSTVSGDIFAFDKNTGKLIWKAPARSDYGSVNSQTFGRYGWRVTVSHLSSGNGAIFQQSNFFIRAVSVADGKTLWQLHTDSGYSPASGVLFDSGKLFVSTPRQFLILDPVSGKRLKVIDKKKLPVLPTSTDRGVAIPSAGNNAVYFAGASAIRKFSCDGNQLWAAKLSNVRYAVSSATEANGKVFAAFNNCAAAFDASSGKLLWSFSTPHPPRQSAKSTASPIVFDSNVIFATDSGSVILCNSHSGKVIQQINLNVPIKATPATTGNLLCIYSSAGTLHGFVLK